MNIQAFIVNKYIFSLEKIKYRSQQDLGHYIRVLADTGQLDVVQTEIDNVQKVVQIFGGEHEQDIIIRISRLLKKLPHIQRYEDISSIEDICGYLLKNNGLDLLLEQHIVTKILPILDLKECTHIQNMFVAFLVNKLIDHDQLSERLAIQLIKFFCFCRRKNSVRSDFMVIRICEYALHHQFTHFFKMSKYYNHLQNILSRIYHSELFLDTDEKRVFSQRILNQMFVQNDTRTPLPKKIAICISGIYRGHLEALKSIRQLADHLQADIYMHTWDETADWPGIGGTPSFFRLFGKENENKITEEFRGLNNILKIEEKFPKVFSAIKTPIYRHTDLSELKTYLGDSAVIQIENQNQVIDTFIAEDHSFDGRGGLNQFKMFYGVMKSFELAKNTDTEYDYFIRVRPDVKIENHQIDIEKLEKNTFYGLIERVVGLTDLEFVISTDMASSFIRMVKEMIEVQRLSPFTYLPKYDSHLLMLTWVVHNKYQVSQDLLARVLLDSSHFNAFPNIQECLKSDLSKLSNAQMQQYSEFIYFLVSYTHANKSS